MQTIVVDKVGYISKVRERERNGDKRVKAPREWGTRPAPKGGSILLHPAALSLSVLPAVSPAPLQTPLSAGRGLHGAEDRFPLMGQPPEGRGGGIPDHRSEVSLFQVLNCMQETVLRE